MLLLDISKDCIYPPFGSGATVLELLLISFVSKYSSNIIVITLTTIRTIIIHLMIATKFDENYNVDVLDNLGIDNKHNAIDSAIDNIQDNTVFYSYTNPVSF